MESWGSGTQVKETGYAGMLPGVEKEKRFVVWHKAWVDGERLLWAPNLVAG